MTDRLIDAVRAVHPDVNVEELADAVWLLGEVYRSVTIRRQPDPVAPTVVDPGPPEPPRPVVIPSPRTPEPPAPEPPRAPRVPAARKPQPAPAAAEWHLPRQDRLLETAARLPVRSPGASALPGTLAMARALRPLQRRVDSRTAVVVDEEATVTQAVDADLWVPATRPAPGRWLDLALVFDDSASMVIWRRTRTELRDLLEHMGAFRDIRVWLCDTDLRGAGEELRLRPSTTPDAVGRDVRELVDPTRRRAVLVVSDCVGRAWQTGEMSRALRTWGATGPVAIVQTLPQRLWEVCAPRFRPARIRARRPGAPNAELLYELADPEPGSEPGSDPVPAGAVPVPVLELSARWFAPWAQLVAGTGADPVSGVVVLADGVAGPPPLARPSGRSPDELLTSYASFASTEALKLAGFLACAPLSLPVMRLVQQAMLPGSRPSVLAEVFLGGLLRRRTPRPERDLGAEEVEYDFVAGVRDRLLATLSRQDKVAVLAKVSDFITARLGSPMDFRAFLAAADDAASVLDRNRPFARVTLQVLRDLGGRYGEAAGALQRRMGQLAPPPQLPDEVDPRITPQKPDKVQPVAELQPAGEPVASSASSTQAPAARASTPVERPIEATSQPAIFGGVPYRNPHFTGRHDLLEQLHTALRQGSSQLALLPHALHGLGGVGKTQLAVEYAYRYAPEYDLVWWVPAESPTTVRQSLTDLAGQMGLGAGDVSQAVANVLTALRTGQPYRRWLVVMDNADRPEDFREYLPVPVGHILVTSRNPQWADVATQLEVDVFDRDESVALLQRRGRDISAADADALADRLGDLPLALDQAAAWQSETGMPAREVVRLLDERISVLLNETRPTSYPVTVMATWELAFNRLREQSPGAAELLELCAFFGSEPIAISLLWDGRHADLSDTVARVLRDDIMLRRAIRDIHRFALAKVDPSRDQIEVHRLVQAVLREQMSPERQEATRDAVHNILGMANPGEPENPRTWSRHGDLLPHVTPAGVVDAKSDAGRRVVLDQIYYRFIRGDYERSRHLGRIAVDRWQESLGPDHELTLVAQRHLALSIRELGDREEAALLNQETFARMRAVLGEDHEHTLFTANSVGYDLRLRGDFEAARRLDEDTLARCRRIFTEDHPAEVLRTMNNMAVNLRLLGHAASALATDIEVRQQQEKILGPNHPSTFISLANTARDYVDVGKYREAEALLAEALPRMRAQLGEYDRPTLMASRVLVMAQRRLGVYGPAREQAEELYHGVRRLFRPSHERVLAAMVTYANALLAVGEQAEARSLAEQAWQGYQTGFGARHPFTLAAALNLAVAMRACEENQAARELDESTLRTLREVLGDDHPYTLVAMQSLGTDLAIAHDHQRARELSEEAYRRSRTVRGEDHPATLASGLNYALDLRSTGDKPAAQALFEEVLARIRRVLGDAHPEYRQAAVGRRATRDIEVWAA